MKCDHVDCTGIHNGGSPFATWCPAMKENRRTYQREKYYSLTGFEYNRLLLRHRRAKALARMRARNEGLERLWRVNPDGNPA